MRVWKILLPAGVALAVVLAVNLTTPKPAEAAIHEIIAALCNGGVGQGDDGEVEPPGQVKEGGQSEVRALIATGFIASIVPTAFDGEGEPIEFTVNFDLSVAGSKFESAGFDLTIEDGFGEGVDLVLSPLPIPDPDFPAHAHCKNFSP